ncbi:FmdE family protein [Halobacteriaceae archaeon GCM10025711]
MPTAPESMHWTDHDVDPIRVRDPVAEALGVLDPGDPFVVTYRDVVKAAGHSCPTAAGSYRMTQLAFDELYPDELPVRSQVAVVAGGPKDDIKYGVTAQLISYVTGAAEEDGFGGLAGGYGGRADLLSFDPIEGEGVTFAFGRTDTGDAVEVTYDVPSVPDIGPAAQHLEAIVEESATDEDRTAFQEAWHSRVAAVFENDDLFAVEATDRPMPRT